MHGAAMKTIVCQNREEWLEQRRGLLTASDAASLMIPAAERPRWMKSPLALYAEKLGLMPEQEETQKMRSGRRLQRAIADIYIEETGRVLIDPGEFTITVHPDLPFVGATLDYLQLANPKADGPATVAAVLEIKNSEYEWEDEPPVHVQIQVQHQLLVTGLKFGTAAVLVRGWKPLHADLPRNEKFLSVLEHKLEEFWWRVKNQRPPEGDGAESTQDALKALYPRDTGTTIALPPDAMQTAADWEAWKAQAKKADEQVNAHAARIKGLIGTATYGVLPDGTGFSWKTHPRAGYTVEPTEVRQLRRLVKR